MKDTTMRATLFAGSALALVLAGPAMAQQQQPGQQQRAQPGQQQQQQDMWQDDTRQRMRVRKGNP